MNRGTFAAIISKVRIEPIEERQAQCGYSRCGKHEKSIEAGIDHKLDRKIPPIR